MLTALILASLSPFCYALSNIFDKYIVQSRVKYYLSYAFYDALALSLVSFIIGLFLDWSNIPKQSYVFPILIGICSAVSIWVYYLLLSTEDISNIIGILYIYPIFVGILSYIFLGEIISTIGYFGIFLTIAGVLLLSLRLHEIKFKTFVLLALFILSVALIGFFAKLSTASISEVNAIVVANIVFGIIIMLVSAIVKDIRINLKKEFKNYYLPFFGVAFWLLGQVTLFYSMAALPAVIVSSISAIQPLYVLFLERAVNSIFGYKITKDERILPKLGAILLIVLGVVLMYMSV